MANEQIITDAATKPDHTTHKVIVYGDGGAGKSASISTILKSPKIKRIIYLFTERNAVSGLEWSLKHYNIIPQPGQVIYVFPTEKKKAFADALRVFDKFAKESKQDGLKGNAATTQGKEHYGYMQKILVALNDFSGTDYATGEMVKIGDVGNLTKEDVLVIDGLSPIGAEIWNTTQGDKLLISMTDYGPAQRAMYIVLSALARINCHVVLLAHSKVETDDNGTIVGAKVNTWVGNATYETLMGLFTDVIYAYKQGTSYKWAGLKNKIHTVSRTIPAKDGLDPDFCKNGFF